MRLIKQTSLFVTMTLCFIGSLTLMGAQSENYASNTMLTSAKRLTEKYNTLYKEFGEVPHFYTALEKAVIADGYTVMDLLILDAKAVKETMAVEYAKKTQSLLDLAATMHVHKQKEGISYVTGGYALIGVEPVEEEERVAVFFGPVRKHVVAKMEQSEDGSNSITDRDVTGTIRYNRHEKMNNQYIVGVYY